VIKGLIKGVESMLGPLGGVLGKVGGFIMDKKGPRPKDLVLLKPAGRAVMEGLVAGIRSAQPMLLQQLGDVTDLLRMNMPGADVTAMVTGAGGVAPGSVASPTAIQLAQGAVQVNIYDASDPVKTAEQVEVKLNELFYDMITKGV
jgi:hypothetical protein